MSQEFTPKTIKTEDNSLTFFAAEYGEAYHSASGAMSEAVNKFIQPCQIEALARKGKLRILDIGFGLGYNALAALYAARSTREDCEIELISLEKSVLCQSHLNRLVLAPELVQYYNLIKALAERHYVKKDGICLTLLEGDARTTIGEAKGPFDAVFLDPFSPKKNPELWTVDFFRQVAGKMDERAILATYSSATPVRCGLIEAGLKVGPGPGDSMKRGGTLATKNGKIPPLSEKETRRLEISPERRPYYDPDLIFSREDIFENRKDPIGEAAITVKIGHK